MNPSEADQLYQALMTKDPRYDGRFYFGVKTTGIYCRPICFARPKKENIRFYRSQAEAEKAGYRPCLRCRPDLSPSSLQWQGTAAVVSRALRLIHEENTERTSIVDLAERLGLSDRHLRRLFEEHLGASPIEIAISKRLHLSRLLLSQTEMNITDVAHAAGFGSLRRFNDAFLKIYKKNPRDFRKTLEILNKSISPDLRLTLPYIAPFDWDSLLTFFKNHSVYGVDHVEQDTYFRHGRIGADEFQFSVCNLKDTENLVVSIQVTHFRILKNLIEKIRHLFDVDHNPHQLKYDHKISAALKNIFKKNPGIRIPGAFDSYETAIGIILGQLVSVEQGRKNMRKLIETFGTPLKEIKNPHLTHFFPSAQVLAKENVAFIGIPKTRALAIQELSRLYVDGHLNLSGSCDLESTRKALLAIKGIGPWTTEMIALRGLKDPNAYPGTDLILKRVSDLYQFQDEHCSPWRGYGAITLWKAFAAKLSRPRQQRKTK